MINGTLYRREMRGSVRLIVIFLAIMTMYVAIIMNMYQPKMMDMLKGFSSMMPQIMAAVGMIAGANTLLGFMISYLYGFILLAFPMIFCMIRANGLVAKYVEKGSMVTLMCAPVKRRVIAVTQMAVMISGIVILIGYATVLELVIAKIKFPKEEMGLNLIRVNFALICLQLLIGSICFFASCVCSETKYSIGVGAEIPFLMFILQMLASSGDKAKNIKYLTFFTLFDAKGMASGDGSAWVCTLIMLVSSVVIFGGAIMTFCRKDLHI